MNNCRVLLADDEAAILEGYKLLFDWEKYQCEIAGTAMDGQEAVEKARELKPDIVIMDINLPRHIFTYVIPQMAAICEAVFGTYKKYVRDRKWKKYQAQRVISLS